MSVSDNEAVQNARIRDIENRVNEVENQLASIITRLDTLNSLGKGLLTLLAVVLGVDVVPMLGSA